MFIARGLIPPLSMNITALIQHQSVKVDCGMRDNGMFCSLFVGQKANVCSLFGSVANLSSLCPLLAKSKTANYQFPRGDVTGRQTDFQGKCKGLVKAREKFAITTTPSAADRGRIVGFCACAWFAGNHVPVYPAQPGQMVGTCPMDTELRQPTTPLDRYTDY